MSPIRRYLRITKYSVLEVRIYPDKPSDAPWLLSSRDNVLQRVIDEVRPTVLPKLREENENAKKKGGKKKRGIKDVASQGTSDTVSDTNIYCVIVNLTRTFAAPSEDFEVTIFLTELSTRHSLLTKQKQFGAKPKLTSTSNKLTGWLNNSENPIHVEDEDNPPRILQEEEDDAPALHDIPEATEGSGKRKAEGAVDEENEPLFVSSDDESSFQTQREQAPKRRRRGPDAPVRAEDHDDDGGETDDDKKKLAVNTSYDGFSIYGRILCLLVKRKGGRRGAPSGAAPVGGSEMMEQWVSTQAAQETGLDEDDEG